MMQNSSIIYHSESLVELQTFGLIFIHFMQEYGIKEHNESDENIGVKIQTENTHAILTVLLIAHIFSYVT